MAAQSRFATWVHRGTAGVIAAALIVGVVAVGSTGGTSGEPPAGAVLGAVGRPVPTTSPGGQVGGRPSPSVSPPRSSASPSARPSPAGSTADYAVVVVDQSLLTWQDEFGQVRAEVIGQVENQGARAVSIPSGETDYSILSPSGLTVASGRFGHAFPSTLEPGERAYLIDTLAATFADPAQLSKVSIDLRFEPAREVAERLAVGDLRWAVDQDRIVVSGRVTNNGTAPAGPVAIAAIVRDSTNRVLCGVYDVGHVAGLAPGASVDFSTSYPEIPALWPTDSVHIEAVAFASPGE